MLRCLAVSRLAGRARRLGALPALATVAAAFAPLPLAAQDAPARAAIEALRIRVGVTMDAAAVEAVADSIRRSGGRAARDAAGDADLRELHLAVAETRVGELTGKRGPLDDAWRRLGEVARRRPAWPEVWYAMGLTKLALFEAGFPSKAGPYQREGWDFLHGAGDAFMRTLAQDPTHVAAAERLSSTVLRQTITPQHQAALEPLRRAAAARPDVPAVHISRALIERENGHADSSVAAFRRYLETGGDSGVAYIELARALYDAGRAGQAESLYYQGARLATSERALAHYRADLAWIATDAELASFDSTTPATRAEWLRRFWTEREVRDARGPGERLAEHYRRLFYVLRNFKLVREVRQERPRRDVGNAPLASARASSGMRIVGGDGTQTAESQERSALGGSAREIANLMGAQPEATASSLPDVAASLYARLNDQTLLRAYRSTQDVVDDRGVIYVRHGEPDARSRYNGNEVDANESWKYNTPEGPRIFHFVGTTAPTRLVDQLQLFAPLLASRGNLDTRYERMASELRGSNVRIKPEIVHEEKERGREAIAVGTTTDSHTRKFDRPLEPVVQVAGLRHATKGGVALVVFAGDGGRLPPERIGPDSVVAYPLALRIIARELATGAIHRLDTTRVFATRRVLADGEYLTGQSELALPPGAYEVTTVLTDRAGRTGTVTRRDSVVVPGPAEAAAAAGALTMSDLVLGRDGSGQRWISAADTVALNPLNAYPRGGTVDVYYQIGGLVPGTAYRTSVEVRRIGGNERINLDFDDRATGAWAAHQRRIGLRSLKPGEYMLTVTVDGGEGRRIVRRARLNVAARAEGG